MMILFPGSTELSPVLLSVNKPFKNYSCFKNFSY